MSSSITVDIQYPYELSYSTFRIAAGFICEHCLVFVSFESLHRSSSAFNSYLISFVHLIFYQGAETTLAVTGLSSVTIRRAAIVRSIHSFIIFFSLAWLVRVIECPVCICSSTSSNPSMIALMPRCSLLAAVVGLLGISSAHHLPPTPEGVSTLQSKLHPGVSISYKEVCMRVSCPCTQTSSNLRSQSDRRLAWHL